MIRILHRGRRRPKDLENPSRVQDRRIGIENITLGDEADRVFVQDVGQSRHHARAVGLVVWSPAVVVVRARITTQDVPSDTDSREVEVARLVFAAGVELHLGGGRENIEDLRSDTIIFVFSTFR